MAQSDLSARQMDEALVVLALLRVFVLQVHLAHVAEEVTLLRLPAFLDDDPVELERIGTLLLRRKE